MLNVSQLLPRVGLMQAWLSPRDGRLWQRHGLDRPLVDAAQIALPLAVALVVTQDVAPPPIRGRLPFCVRRRAFLQPRSMLVRC